MEPPRLTVAVEWNPLGFALWEVEALLRARTSSDIYLAARTLASLSRVVQELPNLEVPAIIGHQVEAALEATHRARRQVEEGSYLEASHR